jgi:WD40 repeat protein
MASDSIWSDVDSDGEFGSMGSFSSLSDEGEIRRFKKSKQLKKTQSVKNKKNSSKQKNEKPNTNRENTNNKKEAQVQSKTIPVSNLPAVELPVQTNQLQSLKAKIELNRETAIASIQVSSDSDTKKNVNSTDVKSASPKQPNVIRVSSNGANSAVSNQNVSKLSPTSVAANSPTVEESKPKKPPLFVETAAKEERISPPGPTNNISSVSPAVEKDPPKPSRLLPSFSSTNKISPINKDSQNSFSAALSPKKPHSVSPMPDHSATPPTPIVALQSLPQSMEDADQEHNSVASSSSTVESNNQFNGNAKIVSNPQIAATKQSLEHNEEEKGILPSFCRCIKVSSHLNAVRIARGKVPKILCASSDSTIQIYNLKTGEPMESLQGHTDRVVSLAISNPFYTVDRTSSSNEKLLKLLVVSGSRDEHVRLWDLDTGQCLHSIHAHKSPIWSVSVVVRPNSDIIIISTGLDGTMKSWDGKTGKRLCNFKGHTDKILSVFVYNPIGEHPVLFSGGGDKVIKAWDLLSGHHIRMFEGHEAEIHSVIAEGYVGFSSLVPVGTNTNSNQESSQAPLTSNQQYIGGNNKTLVIVSGSNDLSIRVWEFQTGYLLFELMGHTSNIYEISLLRAPEPPPKRDDFQVPRGTPLVVSCSDDGSVRIWNITNGKLVKTYKWHKVNTRSLDTAVFPMSLHTALFASPASTGGVTSGPSSIAKDYIDIRNETLILSAGWDKTVQLHSVTEAIYGNTGAGCIIT